MTRYVYILTSSLHHNTLIIVPRSPPCFLVSFVHLNPSPHHLHVCQLVPALTTNKLTFFYNLQTLPGFYEMTEIGTSGLTTPMFWVGWVGLDNIDPVVGGCKSR